MVLNNTTKAIKIEIKFKKLKYYIEILDEKHEPKLILFLMSDYSFSRLLKHISWNYASFFAKL